MSEEEKKKATPTADSPSSGPDISKSMRSESILAFVACILLVLAALSSVSSQLNLSPVYGSIPAARYHYRGITITALLALGSGPYVQKWLPFGARPWIPVVAFWIPVIQCVLFSYSGQLGPLGGPIATESLTYFPLLFLAMSAAITTFESFDMSELSSAIADTIPAVLSYIVFSAGKQSFDAFLPPLIGRSALLTRSGLQTALACAFTVLAPSKLILLAIPAIIHSAWMNPHGVSNQATALLNSTLQQHHYTLIERKESLTGYVSVLESHENQFLVLRCDHSLLGGDWLVTEKSRKRGQRKRETVYSVFTMLESVRLVEGAESRNDADSSALFM